MVERVSTKWSSCHLSGGDSGPCGPETPAWSFVPGCQSGRTAQMSTRSWAGDFFLRPESSCRYAEARDSDLQGPETPVHVFHTTKDVGAGRLWLQPGIGPETFVSGRRLWCCSHIGRRLRPSWPKTLALINQQRLHFVEHYIKLSSTSRRGCGSYSLSSPLLPSLIALDLPL
jgi:hypothetical protein